jgi:cell division protein FtsI/penicillin-binding protein 2
MGTVLQLGKAFSIIANGGYDIEPRLVKIPKRSKTALRKKIYSNKVIDEIKTILQTIGNKYNKGLEQYRVMGKTGTARSIKNGKYSKKNHIYCFGGIVEKGNYKRVIITFVKEPKKAHWWAAEITAPLFNQVAQKMVLHDVTHTGIGKGKLF